MIKTAIITGASRGIGRACAYALAKAGYSVCVNFCESAGDANAEADAKSLCELIKAEGGRAILACADVSKRGEVDEMARKTREAFGDIGLLVNNAGIAHYSQFQDITDDVWQRIFSVNVNGVFYGVQAVLPDFLRNHEGCIINISSIWGQNGASCESAYSATKHAIIGLTRSLAAELGPSGIRANCIAPGVIETAMIEGLDTEALDDIREKTPLCRLGSAQDVAELVLFLAGPGAAFVTGQVLTADGGFTI